LKPCFKIFLLLFIFPGVGLGEESLDQLTRKAEEGDVASQYLLGCRFFNGVEEGHKDYPRAVEWFQKAADEGHSGAQSFLGFMYVTACGVSPDVESGMEWLQKSAAQTNEQAQYYLGSFHEMGRGVEPDRFEAMDWYMKAAKQGHLQSKKELRRLRKTIDTARDAVVSNEWWNLSFDELKTSAEQGDSDAQRHLGIRYKGYGGTEIDFEKSLYWLGKAAAQTNMSAHYSLSRLYGYATNVTVNQAFHHCSVSAEGGYRRAQCALGRYFRDGFGAAPDRTQALHWFMQAKKAGDSSAGKSIYSLIKGDAGFSETGSFFRLPSDEYSPAPIELTIRDMDNEKRVVRLVGYDLETRMVETDYHYGGSCLLPVAAFDKKSRSVLENEASHKAFEKITVHITQRKLSRDECERSGRIFGEKGSSDYDYEGFLYTLKFKNHGEISLKGLDIECRFFYEKESQVTSSYGIVTETKRTLKESRSSKIIWLGADRERTLEIPPFILESYDTDSGIYYADGTPTMIDEDPLGLWVRVNYETVDEYIVYRDFFRPGALSSKVSWY